MCDNMFSKTKKGDLISLRKEINAFPFKKLIPAAHSITADKILKSSPHLDEDFAGWISRDNVLVVSNIIFKKDIPLIYECLLEDEIIYLYSTNKFTVDVCFIKCINKK
jgi:hypothetical protein